MTAPNVTAPSPLATPPAPSTSGAPTTATPTPASTPAPNEPIRLTAAQVPPDGQWMVGKTLEEVAAESARMYQTMQQRAYMPTGGTIPQQTPTYGYQAPSAPQGPPSAITPELPKQEDWLADPASATRKYAEYLQATQFGPMLQQQAATAAQTNRSLVAMQRADEFRRWGPEIDMTLQRMAPDLSRWTPDNINFIVDSVKAKHIHELMAEDRAKYQNELGGAAVRPSGAAGGPTTQMASATVDFDKLPPGYKDALQAKGVTQRVIDEFLWRTYVKSGMEPDIDKARERWVKQVQRGDVFSDNVTVESPVYGNA
jgi:hypothetical protein